MKKNIFFTKTNLEKSPKKLFFIKNKLENIFLEKNIWKYFFPCFHEGGGAITRQIRVSAKSNKKSQKYVQKYFSPKIDF
jgi:hypothetical protein